MVGLQESIDLVRESLRNQDYASDVHEHSTVDHDKILRDYDRMMREHERGMERHRRHGKRHRDERSRSRSPKPSKRFRFKSDSRKSGHRHSRTRRHGSRDHDDQNGSRRSEGRHRTRTRSPERRPAEEATGTAGVEAYAAHPFARPKQSQYLDPEESPSASPQPERAVPKPSAESTFEGPDDAFRASLFDAIADDEGAAYWEGVYGEPIHIYQRPSVRTEAGALEQMNDDEYAEYVKRKMWEKKNPEIVQERAERARRELEEEKKRQRRRAGVSDDESGESDYEWVGNEEKGYERRRIRGKPRPQERSSRPQPRGFMDDVDEALARGAKRKEAKKWQQAWADYRKKWEDLKTQTEPLQGDELAAAVPWPVLSGSTEDVSRDNIEDFFRNYTFGEGETNMGLLKAERFKWHPDKIQHRFGGDNVDAETLKLVTSVFQTLDDLMAQERKKEGRM